MLARPPVTNSAALTGYLRPYPSEEMAVHPVSTRLNSPHNEGAALIKPDNSVRELWD
jgi:putative SOS response-associated peptidase YedK